MSEFYDFSANSLQGQETDFSAYRGKVVLVVNTASKCGFTYQYEGLQALYDKYKDKGLVILGFPCNQFGNQEKGDNEEIRSFCDLRFNITFPLLDKIEVNGPNEAPLYTFLKEKAPGILGTKGIKWNFTKFLVNRDGEVVKRYSPRAKPEDIKLDIKALL